MNWRSRSAILAHCVPYVLLFIPWLFKENYNIQFFLICWWVSAICHFIGMIAATCALSVILSFNNSCTAMFHGVTPCTICITTMTVVILRVNCTVSCKTLVTTTNEAFFLLLWHSQLTRHTVAWYLLWINFLRCAYKCVLNYFFYCNLYLKFNRIFSWRLSSLLMHSYLC